MTSRKYESTVNKEYWRNLLCRNLTSEESYILGNTKCEKVINARIKQINSFGETYGLYIPMLTNMHGNCIFETLQYFNLCDDIDELRSGIALVMLIFKNTKNFIPNQELTLAELFSFRNEVNHVFCKITKKLYKYNFDAMCIDLAMDCSWTRLNTELILTVMSIILNLKFMIFHDNGHITTICINENENTKSIHMGLVEEVHYFPLDKKPDPSEEYESPKYTKALKVFHKWAQSVTRNIDTSSDSSDSSDNYSDSNTDKKKYIKTS
jgi:hypothetical protein